MADKQGRRIPVTVFALISSALIVAVDQLTKQLISHNFAVGESLCIIKNFFYFTYVQNRGAVGGIFADSPWVFNIITVAVIVAALVLLLRKKIQKTWNIWAVCFIIGGGAGNMVDRFGWRYVIDFIDFKFGSFDFYVFNIADSFVVIGCTMLLLYYFTDAVKSARNNKDENNDKT